MTALRNFVLIAVLVLCSSSFQGCVTKSGQVHVLNSMEVQVMQERFDRGLAAYDRGDYEQAFQVWQMLSEEGFASAMYRVADLYEWGYGTSRDVKRTAYYYREAALRGHGDAQFAHANRLSGGVGGTKDNRKAFFWYNAVVQNKNASERSKYHAGISVRVGINTSNYKLTDTEEKLLATLLTYDPDTYVYVDKSLFSSF